MKIDKVIAHWDLAWPGGSIPRAQWEPAIRLAMAAGLNAVVDGAIQKHAAEHAAGLLRPSIRSVKPDSIIAKVWDALGDEKMTLQDIGRKMKFPIKRSLAATWVGRRQLVRITEGGIELFYRPGAELLHRSGHQAEEEPLPAIPRQRRQRAPHRNPDSMPMVLRALEDAEGPLTQKAIARASGLRVSQVHGAVYRLRKSGKKILMTSFTRRRGGHYVLAGSKAAKSVWPVSAGADKVLTAGAAIGVTSEALRVVTEYGGALTSRDVKAEIVERRPEFASSNVDAALVYLMKQGKLTRARSTKEVNGFHPYEYSPVREKEMSHAAQ
jgi:hypothetical protein